MNELSWETMQQILVSKRPTKTNKHKEAAPVTVQQFPVTRKRTPQMWGKYARKEK